MAQSPSFIRTDLAIERLDFALPLQSMHGIERTQTIQNGVTITTVVLDRDDAHQIIGKPSGTYITCELPNLKNGPEDPDGAPRAIASAIGTLLPPQGEVLVVGLGNHSITPDEIGTQTAQRIFATRHIDQELGASLGLSKLRKVSVIAPGVLGQTGIETAQIIKSLCAQLRPACVIAVDALAAKSVARLGNTIQISDTGICPGSGVANNRLPLNQETLGAKVLSLGVPTVVDMATIATDLLGDGCAQLPPWSHTMMVTPREIDTLVQHAAATLALAINLALQPTLTLDQIRALTI